MPDLNSRLVRGLCLISFMSFHIFMFVILNTLEWLEYSTEPQLLGFGMIAIMLFGVIGTVIGFIWVFDKDD